MTINVKTDRELLELAAKAIGHELHVNHVHASQLYKDGEYVCFWAPLEDDGDALRLAVKLELELLVFHGYGEVWADSLDGSIRGIAEFTDSRAADYRLAIVRAAAAIGEGME